VRGNLGEENKGQWGVVDRYSHRLYNIAQTRDDYRECSTTPFRQVIVRTPPQRCGRLEESLGTACDRAMMQRCLELARRALGRTAPIPSRVCYQDGQVLGFHPGAGQPHAEIFALRAAGDRALGATVYVNLEPCNHYGRTPCSEALVAAGVKSGGGHG